MRSCSRERKAWCLSTSLTSLVGRRTMRSVRVGRDGHQAPSAIPGRLPYAAHMRTTLTNVHFPLYCGLLFGASWFYYVMVPMRKWKVQSVACRDHTEGSMGEVSLCCSLSHCRFFLLEAVISHHLLSQGTVGASGNMGFRGARGKEVRVRCCTQVTERPKHPHLAPSPSPLPPYPPLLYSDCRVFCRPIRETPE